MIQPIITAGPSAVDRPDAPPERERAARDEAGQQISEELFNQLQSRVPQPKVSPRFIADLRARLIAQYQLSERQATRVLTEYLSSNLVPGREDPAVLNAAMGRTQVTANQQTAEDAHAGGQQQQQQGAGDEARAAYARTVRGQTGGPTLIPTSPKTPLPAQQQQVAAEPLPPSQPPLPGPRPEAGRTGPDAPVPEGAPNPEGGVVVAQEGNVPAAQPVLARTGVQPGPETPRRPEGMRGEVRYFVDSADPRGTGASTETKEGFYTMAARARHMLGGGQPVPPPPPQAAVVPRDTFQSILKDGDSALASSDSEGGDRAASPLGFGRGGAASLLRRGRARDGYGGSGSGFA